MESEPHLRRRLRDCSRSNSEWRFKLLPAWLSFPTLTTVTLPSEWAALLPPGVLSLTCSFVLALLCHLQDLKMSALISVISADAPQVARD